MMGPLLGGVMRRKPERKPRSTNVLHYPSNMSGYERESLAADAKLKAECERKKQPRPEKR
jgi:hypothetical protein